MHHEQTRSPLVGNQILLLVVLAILTAIFIVQLVFRVGQWNLVTEPPADAESGPSLAGLRPDTSAALKQSGLIHATEPVTGEKPQRSIPVSATDGDKQKAESETVRRQVAQYTVQVGAFRSQTGANRVAQAFRTKGYTVSVQPPPPGRLHLVWVGVFQDGNKAKLFAHQIGRVLQDLGLDGYRVRTTRR